MLGASIGNWTFAPVVLVAAIVLGVVLAAVCERRWPS